MKCLSIPLLLLFILLATLGYAQQAGISIKGTITSFDDNQPIHRANISIDKKGVSTATNTAGMFVLIIPAANLADTLKISCIGFKTKQLPITGIKNGDELNIVLQKNTTLLKEVNIGSFDAMKIIRKALGRIPDNYINHPHILRGFYRMYTSGNNNPLQLSEAVFDIYNFGYADKRADLFKLLKARNEKNSRDFNALEFGQKPNSVFQADVVNHIYASGFLNEDGLDKHNFEVAGIVDIKGYPAYQINFKEKPGAEARTFRGQMFIDTKTYAFIYFDFGLSPTGLQDLGAGTFADRTLMRSGNVEIELTDDHSRVSYQQVGQKWVLSDVEGNDALSVKSPELNYDFIAHVKFNYQITAVDTTEKAPFSAKLARSANINSYNSNDGEKFWKDYNILLSDYDAEAIFKQIQAINKAVKDKGK
jgi:hypothetical protein